jgi:antitoxin ParD1/3/4
VPTLNVNLTGALAEFVEERVEAGDYKSASEVVRDALRLLRDERERAESKLEILRREVAKGLAEADNKAFSTRTVGEIAAGVSSRRNRRAG